MRDVFVSGVLLLASISSVCAQIDSGGKEDRLPVSESYEWAILNTCTEWIHVAVHFTDAWGTVTRGWYDLASGVSTVKIKVQSREVAYHAFSQSGRWSSQGSNTTLRYVNLSNDFDYEGNKVSGAADDLVAFQRKSISDDEVIRINCN